MKKIPFLILLVIVLLSCSKDKYNEIVVLGKILNNPNAQVLYTTPSNGFSYIGFRDTLHADSKGVFKIKCKIDKPGLIQFYYNKLYTVFVEPGDSIVVYISDEKINFEGNNSVGNLLLNSLPRPFYAQIEAKKYLNDTIASSLISKLSMNKAEELHLLDSINNIVRLGKEAFTFLNEDINTYYLNLISEIAAFHYFTSYHFDPNNIRIPRAIDSLWKATYETKSIEYLSPVYSNWWYDYALNYLSAFTDYNENKSGKDNQHIKILNRAIEKLNENNLEVFLARYIHIYARQNNLEPELVEMYNSFISMFPKSSYNQYLLPEINKILKYQENLNNLNPEIIVIPDYDKIDRIENLINIFEDKVIYIDIWATWCGPCLDEFGYYEELNTRYKDSDIRFVFLSTDESNMKKRWLEIIQGYELKGYHLLANMKLQNNLHMLLNDGEGRYFIPRYLLIGPEGIILSDNANKPSNKELLFNQLDELLDLNK